MPKWDPDRYDRFADERARPSRDLIARIGQPAPRRALDLGCGSGLSTAALRAAFPKAEIVGVDLSPDMLAAARKRLPDVKFKLGDAAAFDASGFDLVFANAVFHWVPDHIAVLGRLAAGLAPGGRLAVQMPDNDDEPSHRLMREIARRPAFRGLREGSRERIGAFGDYERALSPACAEIDVWRTTYAHRLSSPEDIVKWVEGSGLRPYIDGLAPDLREPFLAEYREAIAAAYPAQPSGSILFPFPRLFVVATKAGAGAGASGPRGAGAGGGSARGKAGRVR